MRSEDQALAGTSPSAASTGSPARLWTMQLPGRGMWGKPGDHDEAIRVLRRAVEMGVTLIDTADSYGPEVSERLIREALHPYPADLVVATKAGHDTAGPNQWDGSTEGPSTSRSRPTKACACSGCSASSCSSCTASTRLYPSPNSSAPSSTFGDQGKIGHIGLSRGLGSRDRDGPRHRTDCHGSEPVQPLRPGTLRMSSSSCEHHDIGFIPRSRWPRAGWPGQTGPCAASPPSKA